ncbi:MAG: hypothetical protein GXO47_11955 [Chlorobi bacterium]|nr:hypothetical protein [Chlorobiota bacterium]
MKNLITFLFILPLVFIGISSCEQQSEEPGIPGMGDTPGELEISEPFVTPEGVTISLQTLDEETIDNIFSSQPYLKSTNGNGYQKGCGGSRFNNQFKVWIRVQLDVQNTNSNKVCIDIPAGTVFQVSDPAYQNGITISPIQICTDPFSICHTELWLMCVNKGKDGSETNVSYKILGVTGNAKMKNLISRLTHKKCNIEWYLDIVNANALKASDIDPIEQYTDIADHIQNAIWQLTNDLEDLSEEQIEYFESLPEIDD